MTSAIELRCIGTEDIESFTHALTSVIRERLYLAVTTPPEFAKINSFVTRNIEMGYPHIVALSQGEVIGWCDAVPQAPEEREHVARMGMGVIARFRSQGIGRELMQRCMDHAQQFGFEKVELDVYSDNDRAMGLYREFGFHVEGIRVKTRKLDGQYQDIVSMGLFFTD